MKKGLIGLLVGTTLGIAGMKGCESYTSYVNSPEHQRAELMNEKAREVFEYCRNDAKLTFEHKGENYYTALKASDVTSFISFRGDGFSLYSERAVFPSTIEDDARFLSYIELEDGTIKRVGQLERPEEMQNYFEALIDSACAEINSIHVEKKKKSDEALSKIYEMVESK